MEKSKDDSYYILKTIDEIDLICSYSEGKCINDFVLRPAEFDGILFRLIQMAEYVDKITDSFKENHPEIKWRNLKGFRNKLVHDYGSVDLEFVYNAIKIDVPQLKEALTRTIESK